MLHSKALQMNTKCNPMLESSTGICFPAVIVTVAVLPGSSGVTVTLVQESARQG
jgi:hypothetical protein